MEIAVRGLNGLLMIGLPLALGAFLVRRLRLTWGIFGAGGLTFVASQVVHLPFNRWVLQPFLMRFGLSPESGPAGLVAVALLLGLSAGVCEEGARYLAYRYGLRRAREWSQGVLFGAGHGGVEAILLGALALVGLMQAVAYRGMDLGTLLPPGQVAAAQAQLAAYWESPWYFALLGALERASALCVQITLAVMVLQVFVRRQPGWMAIAIGWHALVDGVAIMAAQTWGVLATEGLIAILALVSLGMLYALRPTPIAPVPAPVAAAPHPPPPADLPHGDALESSRYVD
jgi:uncharacterized membrane protein YhfC